MRIGKRPLECGLCGEEEETKMHLFKNCRVRKLMAFTSSWGCHLDAWNINDINELVKFCVDPPIGACSPRMLKESLTIFLSCLFYFT